MKKFISVILAIILISLSFAGCGRQFKKESDMQTFLNGVKEPDALGMYNPQYGFPSFEWKHLDGHYLYFYAEEN